jgi:hypothetical protein
LNPPLEYFSISIKSAMLDIEPGGLFSRNSTIEIGCCSDSTSALGVSSAIGILPTKGSAV